MRVAVFIAVTTLAGAQEFCDPMLTNPPQFCPGGVPCPECGTNRCQCPENPGPNDGGDYCNPFKTDPVQFCPGPNGGQAPCPQCGTEMCACDQGCNGATCPIKSEMRSLYYRPLLETCISGTPIHQGVYTANDAAVVCANLGSGGEGGDYCNPELTNPPQFCPGPNGGQAPCPNCGTNRCKCPGTDSPDATDGDSCKGFWYDSSDKLSGDTYMFYFYDKFTPEDDGAGHCNTPSLKGNASLGASTPSGLAIAIQRSYHIRPGFWAQGANPEDAAPTDYAAAADSCMREGSGCESFFFQCTNDDKSRCGKCTGLEENCPEKFPQQGTPITLSTSNGQDLVPAPGYPASGYAAYFKARQIGRPNLASQKSKVTSVMV